jgi:hypothetical protein
MAKKRPFSSSGIMSDIELQFNRDLKAFIQLTYDGLSSSQGSPVYTGYFASSWKVGLNAIKRESYEETKRERGGYVNKRRVGRSPWKDVYFARDAKGNMYAPLSQKQGAAPRIAPRHKFEFPDINFKNTKKFYIGNTAHYAAYALENPIVSRFVQGEIKGLVDQAFREKATGMGLRVVASTQPLRTPLFGSSKPGRVSNEDLI